MKLTDEPRSITARAANMTNEQYWDQIQCPYKNTVLANVNPNVLVVDQFNITNCDLKQVFFSPAHTITRRKNMLIYVDMIHTVNMMQE